MTQNREGSGKVTRNERGREGNGEQRNEKGRERERQRDTACDEKGRNGVKREKGERERG